MNIKLNPKALSISVGLVVGLVSVATVVASTINVEATKNAGFVKTTKTVNDIKVEIEAPATVDVQPLLNAMPAVIGSDAISKVDNALDAARQKLLPKAAMSIVVSKVNKFQTYIPATTYVECYYSSTTKFNCILYKKTDVDDNTNITMDDIITDLSLAWSFWVQIRYDSPYNVNDKIYKIYYVGNCKKPTDYIYASKEITFDIGNAKKVTIVPFLACTRNSSLYDNTKIIFIAPTGGIIFNYYPRQINMESIKSGSSGFVDFSSLRELFGGSCICKARISKLPDATFTITDGIFRSVAAYGNNKITYGRGHVSNSSGQGTGSVTIPEGDRTDYVEVYIRFDNVYEGGYYGQMCQLSFEINIDGGWKQVPPGGSYIMR